MNKNNTESINSDNPIVVSVGSGVFGAVNQAIISSLSNDINIGLSLDTSCYHCYGTGYLKQKEMAAFIGGGSTSRVSNKRVKCPHCN